MIHQIEKENGTAQSRFELLSMLDSIDFFKNFIPELEELKYIPFNTIHHTCNGFIHSLDVFSKIETILIPDDLYFEVFIAALLHDVGKINTTKIDKETLTISSKEHDVIGAELSKEILKRLKFSNKEIDLISKIIESHMFFKQFNSNDEIKEKTLRKFAKRFNFKEELICCAIAVIVADEKSHKLTSNIDFYKLLDDLDEICEESRQIKCPVNGKDLIKELNLKEGKIIGVLLKLAEDYFYANKKLTKEELITKLKRFL
jgi:poly(A) polymerase/tRNA nucleotidyltransferase (CCA-adding enzyme)